MALSEEHIADIERYIDGNMTTDERLAFELQLTNDPILQQALARHKLMLNTLKRTENQTLKTDLKSLWQETVDEGKVTPHNRTTRRTYLAAASILFLLGAFIVYSLLTDGPSNKELFSNYYAPFETIQTRGDQINSEKALKHYRAGEYEETVPLLLAVISSDGSLNEYRLLLASCYLSLERPNEALETLRPLLSKRGVIKSHTCWYSMLARLKLNDLNETRKLLQEIIASGDDYQKQAQNLLNDLSD